MPTPFLSRPRQHTLLGNATVEFFWERANAILYEVGGILLVCGGFWVFPPTSSIQEVPGLYLKLAGTSCYLIVNVFAAKEVKMYNSQGDVLSEMSGRKKGDYVNLEFLSTYLYLLGSSSFFVGTVLLFPQFYHSVLSGSVYIVGSIAFIIGACFNAMQIVTQETMLELQLMNMTAISFIMGSTLFATASVPSLWTGEWSKQHEIQAFIAWSYMVASILFVIGGAINYLKASIVAKKEIGREEDGRLGSSTQSMPLKFKQPKEPTDYASCEDKPVKN